MDSESGCFLAPHLIHQVFLKAGVNLLELRDVSSSLSFDRTEVVSTCGCGVTAAYISFAAHYSASVQVPLFDGSWQEASLFGRHDIAQIRHFFNEE